LVQSVLSGVAEERSTRDGAGGISEDSTVSIAAFATLAVLTLSTSTTAPAASSSPRPSHRAVAPAPPAARAWLPVGDVYSARAKRRMASYLRMRLLELREQGLRRAIDVVERRLPLDALLRVP
jgi:hypothetical protein